VIVAHDAVTPRRRDRRRRRGHLVAAEASRVLGLPHNPVEAVAAARDKLAMRTRLAAFEVPQPAFAPLPAGAGRRGGHGGGRVVGLPCVIKPATLSGSQGVLRRRHARRGRAVARACAGSPTRPESTPAPPRRGTVRAGTRVAVEGLLVSASCGLWRCSTTGPARRSGLRGDHLCDADPSGARRRRRRAGCHGGCHRGLGLVDGPVHAELRVRHGRATVIEVAARTIGGPVRAHAVVLTGARSKSS